MSRFLAIVLFCFALAGPVAAQEPPLTLPEAVQMAVARHQDVEKARTAVEGLKGKIREVRAQALPDIQITSGALRLRDPSFMNSAGLDKFPPELKGALSPIPSNL